MKAKGLARPTDNLQNRADRSAGKPVALNKPQTGDSFQSEQHIIECGACCHVSLALLAGRHYEAVRAHFEPELLIVHGLQPFFDIFSVFEFNHAEIVSNRRGDLQLWRGKRCWV